MSILIKIQGFGSGSAFLKTLDPDSDPHFKCGSGSTSYNSAENSKIQKQNKTFLTFLKNTKFLKKVIILAQK